MLAVFAESIADALVARLRRSGAKRCSTGDWRPRPHPARSTGLEPGRLPQQQRAPDRAL